MTESFSGCHPYSPHCLEFQLDTDQLELEIEDAAAGTMAVATITNLVHLGLCPRCGEGDLQEEGGLQPVGSRVTRCRCIPVCSTCGTHEAIPGNQVTPWCWPLDPGEIEAELDLVCATSTATVMQVETGAPLVLSDDGVDQVQLRPHPGGWAEFGRS